MLPRSPHILITRPEGQHAYFSRQLELLGFRVSHLPCLAIDALHSAQLNSDPAGDFDYILFTSANAVRHAHALRPLPWSGVDVLAIGSATARTLEEHGQSLAMQPVSPFNSESMLARLVTVNPARLLIVKGRGGRELIHPELDRRGWQVSSADVYQRRLPTVPAARVSQVFRSPGPDIVSVTSNEVLENLVKLAASQDRLLALPLVVNSVRTAQRARDLGFEKPAIIASPAGDAGQLEALQQWLREVT